MNESGLKTEDMQEFWKNIFPALKESGPNLQYELRATGHTLAGCLLLPGVNSVAGWASGESHQRGFVIGAASGDRTF
jgi:hypothetical protein